MKIQSADSNLQINVIARSHPDSNDYWDGNWLESEIRINAPGIKVLSGITLRAEDFLRFYEGLNKMQDGQLQEVEFTTMEEGIYFKGTLDITGNIKWEGIAKLGYEENSLTFGIETDNASMDRLSAEIREIVSNILLKVRLAKARPIPTNPFHSPPSGKNIQSLRSIP